MQLSPPSQQGSLLVLYDLMKVKQSESSDCDKAKNCIEVRVRKSLLPFKSNIASRTLVKPQLCKTVVFLHKTKDKYNNGICFYIENQDVS